MAMVTVSFSLDTETKDTLDRLAKNSRKNRSDIMRDMLAWYRLKFTVDQMQAEAMPLLRHLELETDEQIAEYADKD